MSCTARIREAGRETTDGQASSPVTAEPLERIEHGMDAALEQLEEVSLALTECTATLRMVPLEQVALAARVGVLTSDLRVARRSLETLVIRQMAPSPA